jgi:hypothetical protein
VFYSFKEGIEKTQLQRFLGYYILLISTKNENIVSLGIYIYIKAFNFLLVCLFLAHFVGAALGGFTQTSPSSLSASLISSTSLCHHPPSIVRSVLAPPTVFHWPYSLPTLALVSNKQ